MAQSHITPLDWLMIALYFGILLCVAWWVIRKGKDTSTDYFLAGRNLGWWVIGASIFASNIGSEHIVGLAGSGATSGVAMAHYELHAWCLLVLAWVFVPFYMRSMVFTMPEFLERRFNEKSRYVLSIVSLITFVISKIAVGIFAGGVVFGTLLPEMHLDIGGVNIDSFWIGSVLVIVLTGLYTTLGGMRAVAYNDAVQVIVLICGSALLTGIRPHQTGRLGRAAALLRVGHVQSVEAADPGGCRRDVVAGDADQRGGRGGQAGVVFQRQFPVARHAVLRADHRAVVLVHRPIHRAARAGRSERDGRAPRQHLRRVPEAVPGLPLHHSRPDLFRAGEERQGPGTGADDRAGWQAIPAASNGAFPDDGAVSAAARDSRYRRRGAALRVDGFARRSIQCLLHAVHGGPLREVEQGREPAATGAHGTHRDRGDGGGRAGLDPGDQGRARPLHYLQSVQGYLAPPIFVVFFLGVFFKRLNAAGALWAMIVGFALGIFRMIVDTPVTLGLGFEKAIRTVVPLDRQQYLLPVFQRADHDRVGHRHGGRQLHDSGAGLQIDPEPDVQHRDSGRPQENARELGRERGLGFGSRARLHPGRVSVLPGVR